MLKIILLDNKQKLFKELMMNRLYHFKTKSNYLT